MAGRAAQKDLLSRLADAGEAAIQRLGDAPGADQLLGAANALRDRMDELQRRVRGLEGLEQRLADLERKVDRLAKAGGGGGATKKTETARKTTSTKASGASAAASRSRTGKTRP